MSASPAAAQVSGVVVVDGGPVRGAIAVGEPVFAPRPIVIYQPVRGRRVEVARYAPQVVFVERGHGRHGKSAQWYQRHGYRPVTLFYSEGRYFDLVYANRGYRRGGYFIPVTVWERGGRFYLPADTGPDGTDTARTTGIRPTGRTTSTTTRTATAATGTINRGREAPPTASRGAST